MIVYNGKYVMKFSLLLSKLCLHGWDKYEGKDLEIGSDYYVVKATAF